MQSKYFISDENKNAEPEILKITISEGLGVFSIYSKWIHFG